MPAKAVLQPNRLLAALDALAEDADALLAALAALPDDADALAAASRAEASALAADEIAINLDASKETVEICAVMHK